MQQKDLADILNISEQTVTIVMQYKKSDRGHYVKRLMCVALGMSEKEFFQREQSCLSNIDFNEDQESVSSKVAAEIIGYKPQTMVAMRHRGQGPKFTTINLNSGKKIIRYKLKDLEDWIEKRNANRIEKFGYIHPKQK